MAKRLTLKQKEEIIKSFQEGETVEFLSQKLNFSKLTIIRHLKKNLGESKFKQFIEVNKSLNLHAKNKENNIKKNLQGNLDEFNPTENFSKGIKDNKVDAEFSTDSSFFEIVPLVHEIDNSSQKDLSSIPIADMNFPKTVLSEEELSRKTIEIHNDIKVAKSRCNKEQKVLKVSNTKIFKLVAPFLISKGISRIVATDNLIAL